MLRAGRESADHFQQSELISRVSTSATNILLINLSGLPVLNFQSRELILKKRLQQRTKFDIVLSNQRKNYIQDIFYKINTKMLPQVAFKTDFFLSPFAPTF